MRFPCRPNCRMRSSPKAAGVLVVPYVGTYADVGARPLFAWHGERGAARAAFDALPLIANGCEALIIEVGHKGDQRYEFSDLW